MKFIIIVLLVFALFHVIGYRFLIRTALIKNRKIAISIFVLNYFFILLYLFFRNSNISAVFVIIFSISILLVFIVFVVAIANIIFYLLSLLFPFFKVYRVYFARFMLFLFFIGAILSIYGAIKIPKITIQDIFIDNLKEEMQILQITDLHLSKLLPIYKMRKIVDLANSTNPDIIVLIGDIVDSNTKNISYFIPLLKEFKAKYGVYFVLGNHEFIYNPYESLSFIQKTNITPILNSSITINNNINLLGLSDLHFGKYASLAPNLNLALESSNPNLPNILLAHQPNTIKITDSRINLMLSGHTHGGQIFPFNFLASLANPFLYGLKNINNTQVHISKGAGVTVTFGRLMAGSEINLLKLKPL